MYAYFFKDTQRILMRFFKIDKVLKQYGFKVYNIYIYSIVAEDLGGRAVSALGVRSRKLSTGLNGQSWDE
jgi:hypothetical protein